MKKMEVENGSSSEILDQESFAEIIAEIDRYYGVHDLTPKEYEEMKRVANEIVLTTRKLFSSNSTDEEIFTAYPFTLRDEVVWRFMQNLYGIDLAKEYRDGGFDM